MVVDYLSQGRAKGCVQAPNPRLALPVGMQAERRMQVLLCCHQGLVCVTFTWVLPRPFGVCDIPGAGRSQQLPHFAPVGPDLHQLSEP